MLIFEYELYIFGMDRFNIIWPKFDPTSKNQVSNYTSAKTPFIEVCKLFKVELHANSWHEGEILSYLVCIISSNLALFISTSEWTWIHPGSWMTWKNVWLKQNWEQFCRTKQEKNNPLSNAGKSENLPFRVRVLIACTLMQSVSEYIQPDHTRQLSTHCRTEYRCRYKTYNISLTWRGKLSNFSLFRKLDLYTTVQISNLLYRRG